MSGANFAEEFDPEALAVGEPVGEYVTEALLGVGGFARVYRARHPVLGTVVAVKVLTRALALDAGATKRFIREAQAASRIVHPNVVRVVGFGRLEDGRAYQAMELVAGPGLDQHIPADGVLPIAEALVILDAVAKALSAAHAAGIVHRDVKPANVLLETVDGVLRPRLSDFGIAKALEAEDAPTLTSTGVTIGTPLYMSPEQALGRAVGPASDVYSFGVLAFELLTGRVPFEGDTGFETMMKHVQSEPPEASATRPELGTQFDAALRAMLSKRPEDRPPTVEAAMASLRGDDKQGYPVEPVVVVPKGRRRKPLVVGGLAMLVVVIALIVVAATTTAPDADVPGLHLPTEAPATPLPHKIVRESPPPPAPALLDDPSRIRRTAPDRPTSKTNGEPPRDNADQIELPPGYTP